MAKKQEKKEEQIQPAEAAQTQELAKDSDFDFGEFGGEGFENVGASDIQTPFMLQLQSKSPQVENEMPGAKPGKFFLTSSEQLFDMDTGFVCVVVNKKRQFIMKELDSNKTIGRYAPGDPAVTQAFRANGGREYGKIPCEGPDRQECYLQECHDAMLMLLSDDGKTWTGDNAVMRFKSTKIDTIKAIYTKTRSIKLPLSSAGKRQSVPIYASRVRITGRKEKDKRGNGYATTEVQPLVPGNWLAGVISPKAEPELFQEARSQFLAFRHGEKDFDYQEDLDEPPPAAEETGSADLDADGEELPF